MAKLDKRHALAFTFVVLLMGVTVVAGVIVTETPKNVESSEEEYEDGEHSDEEEGVNLQDSSVAWWLMRVQEYNTSREYTNPDPTGQKGQEIRLSSTMLAAKWSKVASHPSLAKPKTAVHQALIEASF